MRLRVSLVIVAGALIALAAWPFFVHRSEAAAFAPVPVLRDYLQRDKLIEFDERQVALHPDDQITSRMLSGQYMARFSEQGDVGDIQRAENMAKRSLTLQPVGNAAAHMALASALLTYHNFRGALAQDRSAYASAPGPGPLAQIASLLMELGKYGDAHRILERRPTKPGPPNPTWLSIQARYDEETGHLARARALIAQGSRIVDSKYYVGAYVRSWYHFRAAQLAFEAGDNADTDRQFKIALQDYPDNSMALMFQARYYRALKDWPDALKAATKSAELYPLPQALGYEADAQRALGDAKGARETDALIRAEQRLFNVQGINDRLIANYYAQRHIHLQDALKYAELDHRQRGDEIYADDTMAWVLGAMGRWTQAWPYAQKAVRFNIQDPVVEYHAAIVALHTGHRAEAERRLKMALALNPHFHPVYADDARKQLVILSGA